ncbi:MAG: ABC transporter ATP-binding protein, partial [Clostridia bacterium]|nr:ABC transporter ATP-binding protein [Clostridia bacterium]
FDALRVCRGGQVILKDVSFSLRPGRITVLLGKNGAGKSTLFGCLNGLVPYTGEILLDGLPLSRISPEARAKRIGILPQFLPASGFSVRTLVSLGRNPYVGAGGRLSAEDREAVENAMVSAGISGFEDRRADTLSGGERQRAYLAMILAQDTPFIALDEPASHLDADASRRMLSLLRELADHHGKTLLVILHDLTEALALADDAVILADHTCVFSGTTEECLASRMPEKFFGVHRYICTNGEENRIFFR